MAPSQDATLHLVLQHRWHGVFPSPKDTTWTFRRWIWLVLRSATTCVLPYVFTYTIYRRGRTDVIGSAFPFCRRNGSDQPMRFEPASRVVDVRGFGCSIRLEPYGRCTSIHPSTWNRRPLSPIPRGRERRHHGDRSGSMERRGEDRAIPPHRMEGLKNWSRKPRKEVVLTLLRIPDTGGTITCLHKSG